MARTRTISLFLPTALALTLATFIASPVHASIFGELFAKKHAGDILESHDQRNASEGVSLTANDEFAQRTKEAVSSAVTEVMPELQSPPADHGVLGESSHGQYHENLPRHSSAIVEEPVRNEDDPGLGDHVQSSDRVVEADETSSFVPDSVKSPEASPEQLDMSKAIADSEKEATADREASILVNKELQAIDTPVGPEQSVGFEKSVESGLSAKGATARSTPMSAEMHVALKSRVEAALSSLSGVYDALLHSGIPEAGTSVDHAEDRERRAPVAVPVQTEALASNTELPVKEEKGGLKDEDTPIDRAVAIAAPDKGTDSSQATGGFATAVLSVFAGLVFVAALGLMVAGFAFSGRMHESNSHQPLYPPSGPSFV